MLPVIKNQIVEAWEISNASEREEFLKELHRRYSLHSICFAIASKNYELRETGNDEETEDDNEENKLVIPS